MKLSLAAIMLLRFASIVEAQQHAPPAQLQCPADAQVWTKQSDGDLKELTASVVEARGSEMIACFKSAPICGENNNNSAVAMDYMMLAEVYTSELSTRFSHFLSRHDLSEEFLREDAQSKR